MKPVMKMWLLLSILSVISLFVLIICRMRNQVTPVMLSAPMEVATASSILPIDNISTDLQHAPSAVIEYSQDDFSPPDIARARLSNTMRYLHVDDGRTVSKADLPPAVLRAVEWLSVVNPGVQGEFEIPQILTFFLHAQSPPPEVVPGTFGLIDNTPEDPELIKQDKQIENSLSKLGFDVAIVRCDLTGVNLVELIERISKDAQVDIGFLSDGHLVFGHAGKWASSNPPVYQLEFSDKQ